MSGSKYFTTITAFFVTSLIISNIIAVKIVAVGPLFLPAGVTIFPIAYIFGDILTEVYGYGRTRQVIWIGFACNLFAVIAIWLAGLLPAAPFWAPGSYDSPETAQQAYNAILGFAPRLLLASFVAYLAGEFLNSYVLARMKVRTRGKYLWTRTIGSTLVGQLADSAIFIILAFAGVLPTGELLRLIITQWLVKSGYEVLATPLTYLVVAKLKGAENLDVYDEHTDFNPFTFESKGRSS